MKRIDFYSMMFVKGGGVRAVLHHGYTDGVFNYYNNGGCWCAIHKENGYSVLTETTRKAAAEKATAPDMLQRVNDYLTTRKEELKNKFEEAKKAAMEV